MGVVERSEAAKSIGQVTHLVTIRGRACKPTPAKRFKWGLRILEIVGPMDYDERGIEVRVLCRERA
jgi:head-tail adaptor